MNEKELENLLNQAQPIINDFLKDQKIPITKEDRQDLLTSIEHSLLTAFADVDFNDGNYQLPFPKIVSMITELIFNFSFLKRFFPEQGEF